LVDAVTASCALPGLVPTHSINGTRYIDGGVRSPDNADLASGYANVVVLSPLGGRSQTPPGRARTWRASFRVCADHRNGARTWPATSRPCASRAATSR
jgi:predicted acylesterase/phospholipase RssA